jgi:hypothetical protein
MPSECQTRSFIEKHGAWTAMAIRLPDGSYTHERKLDERLNVLFKLPKTPSKRRFRNAAFSTWPASRDTTLSNLRFTALLYLALKEGKRTSKNAIMLKTHTHCQICPLFNLESTWLCETLDEKLGAEITPLFRVAAQSVRIEATSICGSPT